MVFVPHALRFGELRTHRVIGNRPPSYYYGLSRSSRESLEYLRIALTAPVFTEGVDRPHEWTPFFLPGLVSQITRKEFQ